MATDTLEVTERIQCKANWKKILYNQFVIILASVFTTTYRAMASFTWDESTLSADCTTLASMAQRFEDAAALMRQLDQNGFELEQYQGNRIIKHQNEQIFSSFGFVLENDNMT